MSRYSNQNVTIRRAAEEGDIGFDQSKAPQVLIEYPDGTLRVVGRSEVIEGGDRSVLDVPPLPPVGYTYDASSGKFKRNADVVARDLDEPYRDRDVVQPGYSDRDRAVDGNRAVDRDRKPLNEDS